jgi:hypothetical protein
MFFGSGAGKAKKLPVFASLWQLIGNSFNLGTKKQKRLFGNNYFYLVFGSLFVKLCACFHS